MRSPCSWSQDTVNCCWEGPQCVRTAGPACCLTAERCVWMCAWGRALRSEFLARQRLRHVCPGIQQRGCMSALRGAEHRAALSEHPASQGARAADARPAPAAGPPGGPDRQLPHHDPGRAELCGAAGGAGRHQAHPALEADLPPGRGQPLALRLPQLPGPHAAAPCQPDQRDLPGVRRQL